MVSSSVVPGKTQTVPDEWLDRLRSWEIYNQTDGRVSDSTLALYKQKLFNEFLPWVAGRGWTAPLENLTAEHLREYMLMLERKGLAGSTRLVSRGAVRSLWRYMRVDDYIDSDPFEQAGRIPRPRAEEHVVPIVEPLDVERLLKVAAKDPHLGVRDVAMISVLVDSGLRASELCGLEESDVDWREGRLLIRHAKGGRERIVGLGRHAMRALDRYQRWRRERMSRRGRWADPCDSLFITRSGTALNDEQLRYRLKALAQRAGMDPRSIWPHKLRHTSATAMADAGMGESELRALFGWTRDSGMVERYTQSTTALRALRNHKQLSPLDRLRDTKG